MNSIRFHVPRCQNKSAVMLENLTMIRHSNNISEGGHSFCQNQRNRLEFPIKTQEELVVIMIMGTLTVLWFSSLTASAAFRADIALTNRSVNENSRVSTLLGKLSSTDPDTGDPLTYSIQTPTMPLQINGSRQELVVRSILRRLPGNTISPSAVPMQEAPLPARSASLRGSTRQKQKQNRGEN